MSAEPSSAAPSQARPVSVAGGAAPAATGAGALLQVRNLVVEFPGRRGTLRAIDDISFDIAPGEILGVVGESGAGKSLTDRKSVV